jgi:hypothetical protein
MEPQDRGVIAGVAATISSEMISRVSRDAPLCDAFDPDETGGGPGPAAVDVGQPNHDRATSRDPASATIISGTPTASSRGRFGWPASRWRAGVSNVRQ